MFWQLPARLIIQKRWYWTGKKKTRLRKGKAHGALRASASLYHLIAINPALMHQSLRENTVHSQCVYVAALKALHMFSSQITFTLHFIHPLWTIIVFILNIKWLLPLICHMSCCTSPKAALLCQDPVCLSWDRKKDGVILGKELNAVVVHISKVHRNCNAQIMDFPVVAVCHRMPGIHSHKNPVHLIFPIWSATSFFGKIRDKRKEQVKKVFPALRIVLIHSWCHRMEYNNKAQS